MYTTSVLLKTLSVTKFV